MALARTLQLLTTTITLVTVTTSAGAAPRKGGLLDGLNQPSWLKPATAPEPAPEPPAYQATFLGTPDDELLGKMCDQPIVKVELDKGTAIKFKVTLKNGVIAALRPQQLLEQANDRADIAAYWLSRALGLGIVPPACARTVNQTELMAAVTSPTWKTRMTKEVRWTPEGSVRASLAYRVPGVVDGALETSRKLWRPQLLQATPLSAPHADLAEASRIMSWDFLTANWDRWSGDNTRRAGKAGPWVWVDNGAGFGKYAAKARKANQARLLQVERFSRSLVTAVRGPSDDDLKLILAPSGLDERELTEFLARRHVFLTHVDQLIAKHGEADVLAFD